MQRAGVESIVISFAQKTFANGQLTSKLHVIELGAPAGQCLRHAGTKCFGLTPVAVLQAPAPSASFFVTMQLHLGRPVVCDIAKVNLL